VIFVDTSFFFAFFSKHDIREALAVDEDLTHRFVARPGPTLR